MSDELKAHELDPRYNSGSRWHRWEPHIHAPGTVLNDQYGGVDSWENYLKAIEDSSPQIRALGVTDYYGTATYERVCQAKLNGRLPGCELIFPNVEMRLAVGTVKGRWANIHLLVSPEDSEHLTELRRFLGRLTFTAYNDPFNCTPEDLAKLGQRVAPSLVGDAALRCGAEQFKVNFDQLAKAYRESEWAAANILVAVAGNETDGTSGVRDAADATLRQEVEKFAHVIFAGSASQRDFWLGRKALGPEEIRERYGALKPCLHGSDAHSHATVGAPDLDRYSWIKGDLTFDSLRQAVTDPAGRAFVAPDPPVRAAPSQVISAVEIAGAAWATTPVLMLNPGLVAIIGARGSGKTALADAIAAGCDAATPDILSKASFLVRAREHLGNASVKLDWEVGGASTRPLANPDADPAQYPRARYLSQKFVEELCAADGMTDTLLAEIERVIFEAHSLIERDGTVDFNELLELRTFRLQQAREREEDAIASLSDRISAEREKETQVAGFKTQIAQKEQLIAGYVRDRDKLVPKGSDERVARLSALSAAADQVRSYLRYFSNQEQSLLSLEDDVADFRRSRAPEALRGTKEAFAPSGLKDDEWTPFLLTFSGNVDVTVEAKLKESRRLAASWRGTESKAADPNVPLIGADADITKLPLALLQAEIERVQALIKIDKNTANRYAAIARRIADETPALERLKTNLADCEAAAGRVRDLQAEREAAYHRVFEAVVAREGVLRELYRPLMERLTRAEGTLRKLSFSVSRRADVARWATEGEALFDLRRTGLFKGRGTIEQWAEATLREPWERGDPAAVSQAITAFRIERQGELLDLANVPKSQQADYRAWLKRFAKWLYGTDHISLEYSIDYEGTDIRKLSPGTRGIVLLLLYLALDEGDDRPLIIDQPEENLDPKSVFDELVGLFVEAKSKRQVIIVTHNANLVVNTDADQVIVASAGTHAPGQLPPITYQAGGLENAEIRKLVCDILEGGEAAFKERARRLRVRLER